MCPRISLLLFAVLILCTGSGICADIPYVFGDDGLQPLDFARLSECDESDIIELWRNV